MCFATLDAACAGAMKSTTGAEATRSTPGAGSEQVTASAEPKYSITKACAAQVTVGAGAGVICATSTACSWLMPVATAAIVYAEIKLLRKRSETHCESCSTVFGHLGWRRMLNYWSWHWRAPEEDFFF